MKDIHKGVMVVQAGASTMTVVNSSIEGIDKLSGLMAEQKLAEFQKMGESPVLKHNRNYPPKLHLELRDSAKYSN